MEVDEELALTDAVVVVDAVSVKSIDALKEKLPEVESDVKLEEEAE